MNITDVKVFPVEEEKLKAYATITFNNCFIVRDLKVISGNKGFFIAMPSKKRKDGTFRDVAHPLNSETRKMIEDAVLEVYEREAAAADEIQPSITTDETATDVELEVSPVETEPVSSEAEDQGTEATEADQEPIEEPEVDQEPTEEPEADQEPTEEPEADQEPTEEPVMESSASAEEEPEKKPVDNPSIEPSQDPEKAFGYEE